MSRQGNENTNASRLLSKFAIFKRTVSGIGNPAGGCVCSDTAAHVTGVTVRETASASTSCFPDPRTWLRARPSRAPVCLTAVPESCKTPPFLSGCPHCTLSESLGCHFTLPLGRLLLAVRGVEASSVTSTDESPWLHSLLLKEFLNQMRCWRDDVLVITPSVRPWTTVMAEASVKSKSVPRICDPTREDESLLPPRGERSNGTNLSRGGGLVPPGIGLKCWETLTMTLGKETRQ